MNVIKSLIKQRSKWYFHSNIERDTIKNNAYRVVQYTVKDELQLVLMSLKPKEEIGLEKHSHITQFIRVEKGRGLAIFKNSKNAHSSQVKKIILKDGDAIIIPKGVYHNIINTSTTKSLKLYTIYAPPNHPKNRVQIAKPASD